VNDKQLYSIVSIPALLVLLCCLGGYVASAQQMITTPFTMKDGLSQMKVSDIMFDTRGLLWVGTRNGLNKFDGAHFTVYTTQDGLLHDRIHDIGELSDGRIAILNYNGVNIFDGASFESFPKAFNSVMFQMVVDDDDYIWINDSNTGLTVRLNPQSGDYKTIRNDSVAHAYLFYNSEADQKYLLIDDCFHRIDSLVQPCSHKLDRRLSFSFDINDKPYTMEDVEGGVLFSYLEGVQAQPVLTVMDNNEFTEWDPNDIVYVSNNKALLPGYGRQFGMLSSSFIGLGSADYDRIGQLWLGTENGLVEVHKPVFESIPNSKVPYVWSVIENDRGEIWLGTYGDGLYTYDNGSLNQRPALSVKNFFASAESDDRGRLLFAHAGGILVKDGENMYNKLEEPVFAIHFDSLRNQYALGVLGGFKISSSLDSFNYLSQRDGLFENNYIQYIGQDSKGHYWIGSYEGLARYNPDEATVTNLMAPGDSVSAGGVFCGMLDPMGRMWFGGDNGLMLYDDKEDSLTPVESVVLNELVKSLILYDESHMLIATKSGLFVFDFEKYCREGLVDLKAINASIGYAGIEPGFTGLYRDSRNRIWITSSTSLDILDSDRLDLNNFSLRANIATVNDRPVPFDHKNYIFKNNPNNDNLSLAIDAIGSVRPRELQFQYRLDGGEWSPWTSINPIQVNNLSHGRHTIDVRSGPTDMPVEDTFIDTLELAINLPFYKRAFFLPLAITVFMVLVVSLLYYFIKQRRERKALERSLFDLKYLRNQLLLSELNPHFIFNVLASIQHKVLVGKKEQASAYIVKLSKLIRNYLTAAYKGNNPDPHSTDFEVPLDKELEILKSYIEFEQDKSDGHFSYNIEIDPSLDIKNIFIPPMLLQPFVENAIKHGLLLSDKRGMLVLKFHYIDNSLVCIIQDDGVGLKKSGEINRSRYKTHKSLGSTISVERISILNSLGYAIEQEVRDRPTGGTEFILTLKDN